LGLEDVESYIQSGNVLFRAEGDWTARIEKAVKEAFGFETDVILRNIEEMREVAARPCPLFRRHGGIEAARLLVWFMKKDPGEDGRRRVMELVRGKEEIWAAGKELYIYYPDGISMGRLSMPAVDKVTGTRGTGRNWNSVERLIEMAEEMAGN
jgi:uncharacterized protein (DUF1697 family)